MRIAKGVHRTARFVAIRCWLLALAIRCSPYYWLLPFNRRGRLRRHVIYNPIDPGNLIDDPVRYPRQDIVRKRKPVGRHAIRRRDSAKAEYILVRPLVPHDAD